MRNHENWVLFSVEDRIDSFNYEEFKVQMENIVKKGSVNLALSLEQAQFLSLPSIKFFAGLAHQLEKQGGRFALVGAPEKLKRQISIFASLDSMSIFRSEEDWRHTQL